MTTVPPDGPEPRVGSAAAEPGGLRPLGGSLRAEPDVSVAETGSANAVALADADRVGTTTAMTIEHEADSVIDLVDQHDPTGAVIVGSRESEHIFVAPPKPERPPLWHPIKRWEYRGRRFLPGITFPITVYALWRVAQLWLSLSLGGKADTLLNYDGIRYLEIMRDGYANPNVLMPNTAFFPMVSWLAAPIFWVTRNNLVTAHTVATLTGLGAFIAVWGITKAWRNEFIARRAVLLLALFPSSLFLWAFYSEGLFILLGAGAVWADLRKHRGLAAVLFAALAATRSVGVLVPLMVVLARMVRNGTRLGDLIRVNAWARAGLGIVAASCAAFVVFPRASLLLPAATVIAIWAVADKRLDRWCFIYMGAAGLGLAAVLIVMGRQAGDPFAWLKVQDDWGRYVAPPWTSVIQGFENLYPKPETVMVPALIARNLDLWCVPIVLFPLGYALLARKDRFPMETWMIGVALIVLP
ncbi:MAG: hypothetical protein N2037_11875, partial [Acidimicrobiales bacterium]|nr:hypothetical protein [Acidimicrobiales bacterium]